MLNIIRVASKGGEDNDHGNNQDTGRSTHLPAAHHHLQRIPTGGATERPTPSLPHTAAAAPPPAYAAGRCPCECVCVCVCVAACVAVALPIRPPLGMQTGAPSSSVRIRIRNSIRVSFPRACVSHAAGHVHASTHPRSIRCLSGPPRPAQHDTEAQWLDQPGQSMSDDTQYWTQRSAAATAATPAEKERRAYACG